MRAATLPQTGRTIMTTTANPRSVTLLAGVPLLNKAVYHRIRFFCGDPAVFVQFDDGRRLLIIRDVELARARRQARADEFHIPADFAPPGGLSGDREIATAQAAAECLVRHGVTAVADVRSQPYSRLHPQFNREILAGGLEQARIQYAFLGRELGALLLRLLLAPVQIDPQARRGVAASPGPPPMQPPDWNRPRRSWE